MSSSCNAVRARSLRSLTSRWLIAALAVIAALSGVAALLPVAASAFLPDARVYEQVSPPNKDGNFIFPRGCCFGGGAAGVAENNGNGMVYLTSGAVKGTSTSGAVQSVVSKRTPGHGWSTSSLLPSPLGFLSLFVTDEPSLAVTPGFSSVAYQSGNRYSEEEPTGPHESLGLFFGGSNPLEPPAWLGKPESETAFPAPGYLSVPNDGTGFAQSLDGVSEATGTVFFTYAGTLLPQDEVRKPNIGEGNSRRTSPMAWGFYEWHDGHLGEAGELPNGELNQYGAVPAAFAGINYASNVNGETYDGQISEDGTKAYFVSPDPLSERGATPQNNYTREPVELYVREILPNGERKSVLLSHDVPLEESYKRLEAEGKRTPPVEEKDKKLKEEGKPEDATTEYPVSAPSGVEQWANAPGATYNGGETYVYGSRDGSHAYFVTRDALTNDAPKRTKVGIYLPYYTNGGTFTLTFKGEGSEATTGAIKFNASAAEVKSAVEALSNVGAGNASVEGGPNEGLAGKAGDYKIVVNGKTMTVTADGSKLAVETGIYVANENPAYWYDFDSETGEVSYMAGLENGYTSYSGEGATPIALSKDGSSAMFFDPVYNGAQKLVVWKEGAGGGSVETAVELPPTSGYPGISVTPARTSANGNVFMFESTSVLPQFNDGGEHRQIFRYVVSSKELTCASCPPPGVNPTGDVETPLSKLPKLVEQQSRIMSADGSRIFFDTPDPLVGADINGKRDVYEWENGHVFLITSGTAEREDSHYFDSSESGGDVFFTSEAGLVPGDKDGAGDVYDARVPQPGDNPPPTAVPCEGDVCQGPPSVPQLLTPAASAVFNGLGNIPPEAETQPQEVQTKPTTVTCKKGYVKKNGKCVKKASKKKKGKKSKKSKRSKKAKKSNRRGN